jgi:hypothetical protein
VCVPSFWPGKPTQTVTNGSRVPLWALVSALGSPAALVVGATLARIFHDVTYDPVAQTMSVLRWPPRLALAFAGVCGIVIAADPETSIHSLHMTATGLGGVALAMFPALAIFRGPHAPRICEARWGIPASIVMGGLLIWMGFEMLPGFYILGLAERVMVIVALCWPLAVVLGAFEPLIPLRVAVRRAQRAARSFCHGAIHVSERRENESSDTV